MTFEAFIAATFVAHPILMTLFFPTPTLIYCVATSNWSWFLLVAAFQIICGAFHAFIDKKETK